MARQAFATRGYDHTGLRDIARLAGVDKRLLTHYFGSKQRLFADALDSAASRFEVQDRRAYASFGTDFVEHIFGAAQLPPEVRLEFISLCLHSSASPAGRELIAANITRQIGRIAANLNGTDAALRASLLLAGLLGISVLREVLAIEPLLHLGPRTARQHIAPWLQSLLDPQRSRPGARR